MPNLNLQGKIAVVTGGTRSAGRGIALVLGEAGATVYITGRSVRGGPTTENLPETIDETAEMVTARGGMGIPVPCDHTVDEQVEALFARIKHEYGRLDILVNNVFGGYEGYDETFDDVFWKQPIARWHKMLMTGVRSPLVTSRFALPLMMPQRQGVIINTTVLMDSCNWDLDQFHGNVLYDTAKTAVNRMTFGMAHNLRPYNIAVVAVAPGFMRNEAILEEFNTDEHNWHNVPELKETQSTQYVGRAVAALAADPNVMQKTGQRLWVGHLAREYGFTDIDGRQP